jgi:hypothetical protein
MRENRAERLVNVFDEFRLWLVGESNLYQISASRHETGDWNRGKGRASLEEKDVFSLESFL